MEQLDSWLDKALESDLTVQKPKNPPNPNQQPSQNGSPKKPHRPPRKRRPGNKPPNPGAQGNNQGRPQRRPERRSSGSSFNSNKNLLPRPMVVHAKAPIHREQVRIITIGGLNEVGKNMTAIEYEDDIIIVDCGLEFPSEQMMGVDYVIPDTSYLEARKDRIRGIIITHGHLDHIGALPYVLEKLNFPPVFSTKLTNGFILKRAEEFNQDKTMKIHDIHPDDVIQLGKFRCRFMRVMHSIPDSIAIDIETPIGRVVHSGDYKFDETPHHNIDLAEIHKMEALGQKNVLVFLSESTNALKPGHSISEKDVGEALEEAIATSTHRVIVATFSSQISRLQQVADSAAKHNRRIFVSGRSMRNNIEIAIQHGYLKVQKDIFQDIKSYPKSKMPDHQVLILTTGSQGEDVAALTKMASMEHPQVRIQKGDTVIFSSSPIIGNERAIYSTINKLSILGARVIHNKMMDVHTSGHGNQDELARMINYIKPRYLIPIHGEYYMRQGLKEIALERCGMKDENVILMVNGSITIAEKDGRVYKSDEEASARYVLIDGKGEGYMDSHVQQDRDTMSKNGVVIVLFYVNKRSKALVGRVEVVSRGFMYSHEPEALIHEMAIVGEKAYKLMRDKNPHANRNEMKKFLRNRLEDFTKKMMERTPLIMPLLIEV